jgi:hypothetical protein
MTHRPDMMYECHIRDHPRLETAESFQTGCCFSGCWAWSHSRQESQQFPGPIGIQHATNRRVWRLARTQNPETSFNHFLSGVPKPYSRMLSRAGGYFGEGLSNPGLAVRFLLGSQYF